MSSVLYITAGDWNAETVWPNTGPTRDPSGGATKPDPYLQEP